MTNPKEVSRGVTRHEFLLAAFELGSHMASVRQTLAASGNTFWVLPLFVALSSLGCTTPNVRAGKNDLPGPVRDSISHNYGPGCIPRITQFGPLEPLRQRYGDFIPYYSEDDFNADGRTDFVCLLFEKGQVAALVGLGDESGNYRLQKIVTGFPVMPQGKSEVYVLDAQPGKHQDWNANEIHLDSSAFYLGTLHGPEYLFVWRKDRFERILTRD